MKESVRYIVRQPASVTVTSLLCIYLLSSLYPSVFLCVSVSRSVGQSVSWSVGQSGSRAAGQLGSRAAGQSGSRECRECRAVKFTNQSNDNCGGIHMDWLDKHGTINQVKKSSKQIPLELSISFIFPKSQWLEMLLSSLDWQTAYWPRQQGRWEGYICRGGWSSSRRGRSCHLPLSLLAGWRQRRQ